MILNVSGRTDIVAFYTKWFMNRYREGFVDVRNPFNFQLVSRINFEHVDAILFCTKNPIPILEYLKEIDKPMLFHVTITPYKTDVEPNVPSKTKIIEAVKKLSNIIGIENLYIRYDPMFLSDKYNIEYHKKAFERMCLLLNGYVKLCDTNIAKLVFVLFLSLYECPLTSVRLLSYTSFATNPLGF